MFQLKCVPVLSDIAVTFLSSVVVLTPHGKFLDCVPVSFSQRYMNDPITLGELLTRLQDHTTVKLK
jgi:hypothetical protein